MIDGKIKDEKLQYNSYKQQKYKHYHLEKLVNMVIFLAEKYCLLIKGK